MKKVQILGIFREKIYSNHAIEADREIMTQAINQLNHIFGSDCKLKIISPHDLKDDDTYYDIIISMGQGQRVLNILNRYEKKGTLVVNSVNAIKNCYRIKFSSLLKKNGLAYPKSSMVETYKDLDELPFESSTGYWVKRGGFHALSDEDVVYVKSLDEINMALKNFGPRSIEKVIIQKHIPGQVIKFYAVTNTFFKYREMDSPLKQNFIPAFINVQKIRNMAYEASKILSLEIYGGDCIITPNYDIYLIDMNDWPSFRTCQKTASVAMAQHVNSKLKFNKLEAIRCGQTL